MNTFSRFRWARAAALGGLLALAAGCRTCPVEACRVRKVHLHNGVGYRGVPAWMVWKKKNLAVGEQIRVSGPSGAKPVNNHAKPLK